MSATPTPRDGQQTRLRRQSISPPEDPTARPDAFGHTESSAATSDGFQAQQPSKPSTARRDQTLAPPSRASARGVGGGGTPREEENGRGGRSPRTASADDVGDGAASAARQQQHHTPRSAGTMSDGGEEEVVEEMNFRSVHRQRALLLDEDAPGCPPIEADAMPSSLSQVLMTTPRGGDGSNAAASSPVVRQARSPSLVHHRVPSGAEYQRQQRQRAVSAGPMSPIGVDESVAFFGQGDDDLETGLFDRNSHQGAIHYVTQALDKSTGQKLFAPADFTAKVGDVCVVRMFGHDNKSHRSREGRRKLAGSLSSDSTVVEPKLTLTGALVITLGQLGNQTFMATDDPDMSFTVHVVPAHDVIRRRARVLGLTLAGALLLTGTVLAVVLWANARALFTFLMAEESVPNLHGVERRMEDLFFRYAFPWFVIATVFFGMLVVVRIALVFRTQRVHDFRRGYTARTHLLVRVVTALLAVVIMVLSGYAWVNALQSNQGFTEFFTILAHGANRLSTDALATAESLQILTFELPFIMPSIEIPSETQSVISEVKDIADSAKVWSANGEDLIRGAFRLVALLRFVGMTIVMFVVAMAANGAYFGNAQLTRGTSWSSWFSITIIAAMVGTSSFLLQVAKETHKFGEAIVSASVTEGQITQNTGISDHTILKLVVACSSGGLISPTFMNQLAHSLVNSWNDDAPRWLHLPTNFTISDRDKAVKQIQYISKEILVIEQRIESDPILFHTQLGHFINVTAPLMRATLDITNSVLTIADCGFVREDFGKALPHLYHGAIVPLETEFIVQIFVFLSAVALIPVAAVASFVLRRPLKKWYCWTTRRWFRFRYSLYIHRKVNAGIGQQSSKELVRSINGDFAVHTMPWCSVTGLLLAAYLMHHTMGFHQALLGGTLLLLNFSATANQLPTLLFVPAIVMLVNLALKPFEFRMLPCFPRLPRPIIRVVYSMLAIASLTMAFSYANTAGNESTVCINEIKHHVNENSIFYGRCSASHLFWLVETSAYSVVVGVICSMALFCTLILLLNVQRQVWLAATRRRPGKKRGSAVTIQERDPSARDLTDDGSLDAKLLPNAPTMAIDVFDIPELGPEATLLDAEPVGSGTDTVTKVINRQRYLIAVVAALLLLSIPIALVFENKFGGGSEQPGGDEGFVPHHTVSHGGCNGSPALCDLRVDEIVWATSHNAMSSMQRQFVAPNNYYSLQESLHAGFRVFMLDVFPWSAKDNSTVGFNTTVYECHGACFLGGYPMLDDMRTIKSHLIANPKDVVILMFEQYVTTHDVGHVLEQAELMSDLWRPTTRPCTSCATPFEWPTLNELIGNGTRLMFFTDETPGSKSNPRPVPSWSNYLFDFMFETPYHVESATEFGCVINRGGSNSSSMLQQKASILNHFVTAPLASPFQSEIANDYGALTVHWANCSTNWALRHADPNPPNFVAVDFWSIGDTLPFTTDMTVAIAEAKAKKKKKQNKSQVGGGAPLGLI